MAEKIVIAELDINMEEAIKETIRLKQEIVLLNAQTAKAKEEQGELSSEYIQYSAALKGTQSELKIHEQLLTKASLATNEQTGSMLKLEAQNSALRAEQRTLNLETEKGLKRNKEIVAQINANTKAMSQNSDEQKKGWFNIGRYGDKVGQTSGILDKMIPGFSGVTSGAQAFGLALKLALGPIGLIIAAVAALISYFKRTEEGQNSLAKIMAVFNVILQNVLDVVGKVGEALFNAVMKPKEAWEKFKEFIGGVGKFFQDTFGNVIGGSIEVFVGFLQKAFANVGLAWQKLKGIFVDNTKGINAAQAKIAEFDQKIQDGQERVKKGATNLKNGIVNAYNSAKNALTDFIKENQREIEITKTLADMKAALRKRERQEIVRDAKDDMKIADLRFEAAQKDKYTAEQRLKFMDEATELNRAMMRDDLDIAKVRANIGAQEIKMRGATAEMLDEQAKLEAEIFRIQQRNAEAERGYARQRQSAINDMLQDQQALTDASIANMQTEVEAWKITNRDKLDSTGEYVAKQKEILQAALDAKINEIDARENESEELKNAEKLRLQNEFNLQKQQLDADFEDSERARKLEVATLDFENEAAIFDANQFRLLEIQRQHNKVKLQEELRNAEKIGASTDLIQKKYQKASLILSRAERDAKLQIMGGFASNVATIFGQTTKVGKAAAVAATTIETYRGAQAAYTSMMEGLPAPINVIAAIVAAAAAVATGVSNVQKILAVSDTGGTSTPSSSPAQASSPPVLTSSLQSVNTELGQGIVSRGTSTIQQTEPQTTTTLVVDKVTDAQKIEATKNQTSVI